MGNKVSLEDEMVNLKIVSKQMTRSVLVTALGDNGKVLKVTLRSSSSFLSISQIG
jgi:hypothetical protein